MSNIAGQIVGSKMLTTEVNERLTLQQIITRKLLGEDDNLLVSMIKDPHDVEFTPDFRYPRDQHLLVDNVAVSVYWEADIEWRSWGIKDIFCRVKKVVGWIDLEGWENVEGEEEGQDIKRRVDLDQSWQVESRWRDEERKPGEMYVYPTQLVVDEGKKHVIVYF